MNIRDVLKSTIDFFEKHHIPGARLDAEVLLAHVLKMDRVQLYVKYDLPLKEEELEAYRELVLKRVKRVPVAYLTGKKEFMSLELMVNGDVLIPRPETELLVEEIINYCKEQGYTSPNIVDIGTGNGAIAVALGYYLPEARVLGIDISEEALKVASLNIKKHGLEERVKVLKGDLLEPLIRMGKKNVDLVVSNPPYIDEAGMEELSPEVKQEPALALKGGSDGLTFYRKIIPQASKVLKAGGSLFLEVGAQQGEAVQALFDGVWSDIVLKQDYAGQDRIIQATYSKIGLKRKSYHVI